MPWLKSSILSILLFDNNKILKPIFFSSLNNSRISGVDGAPCGTSVLSISKIKALKPLLYSF